jgi:hypothetical protein
MAFQRKNWFGLQQIWCAFVLILDRHTFLLRCCSPSSMAGAETVSSVWQIIYYLTIHSYSECIHPSQLCACYDPEPRYSEEGAGRDRCSHRPRSPSHFQRSGKSALYSCHYEGDLTMEVCWSIRYLHLVSFSITSSFKLILFS